MKRPHITLSIIIVTWNSEQDIINCLSSVYTSTRHIKTEIIVVDNKSSDQTVQTIHAYFPNVHVLKQKINYGFGQGNNIGLRKAKGTYILLLNPDTIMNAHAVKAMMHFLDSHPRTGVVGPEQFNDAGNMIFMTSRLSLVGVCEYLVEKLHRIFFNRTVVLFPWPHKTYMLNAGCLLTRKNQLPTRQWFDPECFIYGEEQYLFKRVNEQHWHVYFLRNCSIVHLREKSIMQTKNKAKYTFDSAKILLKKSFVFRN